jgi:hypothetical protein
MPENEMPYRTADTRDLVAVHRAIARVARYLVTVAPSVAADGLRAAGAVADLATELADALARLAAAEGELLWPVLRGYLVAMDDTTSADTLLAVQAHGGRLVRLGDELAPIVTRFRASAAAADRDALTGALLVVRTHLEQHFADVEQLVLPLAERYMTVAQWDEIGRHFLLGVSPRRREFRMGAMLLECDRRDRARVLRSSGSGVSRLAMARARRTYLRECGRIRQVLDAETVAMPVTLAAAS